MTTIGKVKTVSEYRARFTDPNSQNTHTITSNDLDSLQGDIRHALGNTVNFEPAGNSQIIMDQDAGQVLGWISSYEVPQSMSVKNVTQLTRARAA
jgi:hypothetical protein